MRVDPQTARSLKLKAVHQNNLVENPKYTCFWGSPTVSRWESGALNIRRIRINSQIIWANYWSFSLSVKKKCVTSLSMSRFLPLHKDRINSPIVYVGCRLSSFGCRSCLSLPLRSQLRNHRNNPADFLSELDQSRWKVCTSMHRRI